MKYVISLTLLLLPTLILAENQPDYRGWDHLVAKLRTYNLDEITIRKTYTSKKMPRFTSVSYSIEPKESKASYRHFTNKSRIETARNFLKKYKSLFDQVEREFKVSRNIIASILLVETHYGKNTGKHLILNRLSRVCSVTEPKNMHDNYLKKKKKDKKITKEKAYARGKYLEKTFCPELLSLFKVAEENKVSVFRIFGSHAGAFGLPQFMPSSYMNYAVDFDKNGKRSLFSIPDALASTANYLAKHGWKDDLPKAEKEKVIWFYNHSDAYVDTILEVARILEK